MNPLANQTRNPGQNPFAAISSIIKMLQGKDANAVSAMLAERNPQYREFVAQCQGKTPDEIANMYGVDISLIKQMLK